MRGRRSFAKKIFYAVIFQIQLKFSKIDVLRPFFSTVSLFIWMTRKIGKRFTISFEQKLNLKGSPNAI